VRAPADVGTKMLTLHTPERLGLGAEIHG
jgi:hypothetical protein